MKQASTSSHFDKLSMTSINGSQNIWQIATPAKKRDHAVAEALA